jgi:alkyl hydroperoxide reductase subunit D
VPQTLAGSALATLLGRLPETAKDLRLNVTALMERSSLGAAPLTPETPRTLALACAIALKSPALVESLKDESLPLGRVRAAETAAGLMAMNNVYYRFRHLSGVPEYATTPAGLRMSGLATQEIPKPEFELLCLAISALNACESCIKSHDKVVRDAGFSAANVLDAVRLAASLAGVATLLPPAQG